MAALVSSKLESLQIALAHLFFNVTGVIIWYPVPFMRRFVFWLGSLVGKATESWRGFPVAFIVTMFFVLPLVLLGLSVCFEQQSKGFTALGVFLILLIVWAILYFVFWWRYRNGKASCKSCIRRRQRKKAAIEALADDMDYLKVDMEYCKNEIGRLKDFAGMAAVVRMEEGKTYLYVPAPKHEAAAEGDETASALQSMQSKPWRQVLFTAVGSIHDDLNEMERPIIFDLGASARSARRALQASGRSARRALQASGRPSRRGAVVEDQDGKAEISESTHGIQGDEE